MPATYEPIFTVGPLTSTQLTITFTSIPATYTDLVLEVNAAVNPQSVSILRVNGDTGSNYSRTYMQGGLAAFAGSRTTNDDRMYVNLAPSLPAISTTHFMNYTSTSIYKTILQMDQSYNSGSIMTGYLWRNTAAINQISIEGGSVHLVGSTFTLFGIKAA